MNSKNAEMLIAITQVIVGIALVVVGIYALAGIDITSVSGTAAVRNQSYGGDAYTGIQNASAAAATNAANAVYLLEDGLLGLSKLLCVIGLVLIIMGIMKIVKGAVAAVSLFFPSEGKNSSPEMKHEKNSPGKFVIADSAEEPSSEEKPAGIVGTPSNEVQEDLKTPMDAKDMDITDIEARDEEGSDVKKD